MAGTSISAGNKVTRFQNKVAKEYVREGRFGPDTGSDENAIFQINRNLKKTSVPIVGKTKGRGAKGSEQLSGKEQPLANDNYDFKPTHKRQGITIDMEERELSEFDIFQEARPSLMGWMMELKRDEQIQALLAIKAGDTYYNYGGAEGATDASAASAANMDTWNTNNEDRILYGSQLANYNGGDHTASLATIDTTNDKMTASVLKLMKRRAQLCDPLIRPIRLKGDYPVFKVYMGSLSFRDLSEDDAIVKANREARPRVVTENPIFMDGDIWYNGMIVKEIPEIDKFIDDAASVDDPFAGVWGAGASGDNLKTAGNSSSRVAPAFLCGAQSVVFGVGKLASFKRKKEDDYEFMAGVAIQAKHDIKKIYRGNKQHGIVTCFHSAAADA